MNTNTIDFNYQDGLNRFPIQDYIDERINNNNNNNLVSSNIFLNDNSKLDKTIYYNDSNLIICNSNALKNIEFKTSFSYPSDITKAGTIIDFTGKLQVYHNYNILQPTFLAGYYDVEGELLALKADGINTDAQLTLLEAGAIFLQGEINDVIAAVNLVEGQLNCIAGQYGSRLNDVAQALQFAEVQEEYGQLVLNIATNATVARDQALIVGGIASIGIGIAGALLSSAASAIYYNYASNSLILNSNITDAEKSNIYFDNTSNEIENYSNYNINLSNLNIINGFINSNIITQQLIPSLNTNELKLNNININNVYLPRTGGSLSGGIAITPATIGTPSTGNFGGNGDRIILYSSGTTLYPYSIGIASGSLWNSVPSGGAFDWYIQGSKVMTIDNNGNLTLKSASYPNIQIGTNNNLGLATADGHFSSSALAGDLTLRSANNLILQSGGGSASIIIKQTNNNIEVKSYLESSALINSLVSLQENSINLSGKYLQITDYNNDMSLQNDIIKKNYTLERKYPPKIPDSSTTTSTATTFLGQSAFYDTLTINSYINGYGLGTYTIYSTSYYSINQYTKNDLFNIDILDVGGHWQIGKYNSTGNYIGTTNYIKSDYNGEWIVIKLPTQIILTKYRFYQRRAGSENRAPGLFKWYGSNDGINFTEIVEASNTTTTAIYSSYYYEKTLVSTFTTPYLYLGLCVNKLLGNDTVLNFAELMIWGKELLNPIINYTPTANLESSVLAFPNISKKYGFTFTCSATTTIGLITYYKYDIDLRKYTQLKYTSNNSPYRIFNIRLFLASCFFQFLTNSNYNILSYEVYMSNQLEAGTNGATIGLHVVSNAIGATYPSPLLANVLPSAFSLMRTTDFNYLTVISTIPNIKLSCVIEDLLF